MLRSSRAYPKMSLSPVRRRRARRCPQVLVKAQVRRLLSRPGPLRRRRAALRRAKFIALDGTRPIEFLLYLYFGKTEVDLKNFALRDLGILRTNQATSFSARFTDAEEAIASFHYSRLLDRLEVKSTSIYRRAAIDVFGGPGCLGEYAADLRSRAAHQTGLYFEKRAKAPSPGNFIVRAHRRIATSV